MMLGKWGRLIGVEGRGGSVLTATGAMLLFWAIFDGLLSYLLPIKIISEGFSKTQMGLIIASSNVFGAVYDLLLAQFIRNTNYRRLYLLVFGLCFIYPLLLWPAKSLWMFLIAMSVWGLYGDLNNFATFDLISRRTKIDEHAQSFGVLSVFKSLGYLVAPLIAGLVVVKTIDFFPFSLALSFIFLSFIFYLVLVQLSPRRDNPEYDHTPKYTRMNFLKEFRRISGVGKALAPVLVFNTMLYIFDGAFWTIGPIFAESFAEFRDFGGLFMTAYTLPTLLVGWFVGKISRRIGKKKTAYLTMLIGCLAIIPIGFIGTPLLIIVLVFISSVFSSIAWPAIRGAYADYICESKSYSREIEGLNDFTCNLGYIIGPALSGYLADVVGLGNIFTAMATVMIVIIAVLFAVTPRQIKVVIHRSV